MDALRGRVRRLLWRGGHTLSDPYKTSLTSLRTNATSLLGQAMALDSVSPWRGELVARIRDLLGAINFVEADDRSRRLDDEKKARSE